MNQLAKKIAARIPINLYQRLLAYSIMRNQYPQVYTAREFPIRERLWDHAIELAGNPGKITFVEFGVHQGYSIKYFAAHNSHPESTFIGLDSFEGLPEDWDLIPKGTFDVQGIAPLVEDRRVTFIKGWFQDTSHRLRSRLDSANGDQLIVHYDADLYSSTLHALVQIDALGKEYLAIFDEFTGHEVRALYSYAQSFNAEVTILSKTMLWSQPRVVLCRITPRRQATDA